MSEARIELGGSAPQLDESIILQEKLQKLQIPGLSDELLQKILANPQSKVDFVRDIDAIVSQNPPNPSEISRMELLYIKGYGQELILKDGSKMSFADIAKMGTKEQETIIDGMSEDDTDRFEKYIRESELKPANQRIDNKKGIQQAVIEGNKEKLNVQQAVIDDLDLSSQKVLTGMRPSGKLHLGHYFGALTNWLALQNKVKCQFLIADYHVLGERTEDIERLKENVMDVVMDWLSVGIDPEKSDFVVQSYVPEGADLAQYFSMITPYSRLAQNPTLKNEMRQLEESGQNEALSLGFFGYPVSQALDILLPRANLVPVGADQIPHIELARYIARTFNRKFGNVFEEPRALLSPVSRLVGIDGNDKMSKSLGNTIMLSDSADRVKEQVMKMYTDPNHLRVSDPGRIEGNVVFTYLDIFESDGAKLAEMKSQYQKGGLGDVTIKKHLIQLMNDFLQTIRERRAYYETRPDIARDAIEVGSARARKIAQETIEVVKSKIGIQRY